MAGDVLVLFDRSTVERDSLEPSSAGSEEISSALDLITYLTPWAYATGRRLILAADGSTALAAVMALVEWLPPRPLGSAKSPAAPVLFAPLPLRGRSESEAGAALDDKTREELRDLGLLEIRAGPPQPPHELLSHLFDQPLELIVMLTHDEEVARVLRNRTTATPCFTISPFAIDLANVVTLRPSPGLTEALPLISGDEVSQAEERRTREAAAVLVDLLAKLDALETPRRFEFDPASLRAPD